MAVYIHLFHGRKSPVQKMDDWGTLGPTLGPFRWVHTTYATDIKLGSTTIKGGQLGALYIVEDMVYYDGVWYGDWSVFDEQALAQDALTPQEYVEKKALPPGTARTGRGMTLPLKAMQQGEHAAEETRTEASAQMSQQMSRDDDSRCLTCGKPGGRQQKDRGLGCGIHHDECFEEMRRQCRKRSW